MQHYSLLVNGLGHCVPRVPTEPYYSRLLAWTNNDELTYVCADLTRVYARSNFHPTGYGLTPDFAARYNGGPLRFLTNVNRHLLFPRKKYWVVFDVMQTVTNATFSWLYHVLEPTATINTNSCSFSYTASNHYRGKPVVVYVSHVVDSSKLNLTNMTGTNLVRANPITGENYRAIEDGNFRSHAIWVSNRTPTTNWHFMSVIYPVRQGETPPVVTRLDDFSVRVQRGADDDLISFNPARRDASTYIDLEAMRLPSSTPTVSSVIAPGRMRVVGVDP
jgi:hypothetical protein